MRAPAALVAVLGFALATTACDQATEPPFLPDGSPAPPDGFQSFRAFAPEIEAAVRDRDAEFFLALAQTSSVSCPYEFEPRCQGQPAGTVVEGISLGFWRSEGSLLTREDIAADLAQYLASLSEPALHALAWLERGPDEVATGPAAFAVVVSADDPEGTTRVLGFVPQDGAWRMLQVIVVPVLAEEWLAGDCSDCYDDWERWEGAE